ncbi:MAG: hypothetical protein HYY06_17865 [Deltaproteobacteria bacterium]|nr:hypothetical protein [Deltaproteobacteria bacterium]
MRRLLFLSLGAAWAAGCGSDPGSIDVHWTIGATNDCERAEIAQIRITLREEGGGVEGPFMTACASGTSASSPFRLNDIEEGSYTIVVEGLDATGKVIYMGQSSARYAVEEGKNTPTDAIQLSPAPPSIRVRWSFVGGGLCGPNLVETVEAKAFFQDTALATGSSDCNDGEILLQETTLVPGEYEVQVNGRDAGGVVIFRYTEVEVEVSAGEETLVSGQLEACATLDDGCP